MMLQTDIENLPYRANVGVMVLSKSGDVFVAQRLEHYANAWQMPQGGIDPGEGPAEAALRELEEETGINSSKVVILAETQNWIPYELPPDLIPKLWNGKYRGQKQKWFLMRFLGEDTDIDIETEEPEFSSWKWIAPSALPDAIVPFKRDVYVAVLEAFQSHL
jgi:putative (di)nucleoside polyphosphate hydrolase|tara:strand:+ start:329 stop:814 length:486 start_codon:yes stop_codon:yes gene_type:complete